MSEQKLEIRKMLVLSTAHLPEEFFNSEEEGSQVHEGVWGTIVYNLRYGALLWVPNNPEFEENDPDNALPPEVLNIQLFARAQDCDWVMFDADADEVEGLATWDWGNPTHCTMEELEAAEDVLERAQGRE